MLAEVTNKLRVLISANGMRDISYIAEVHALIAPCSAEERAAIVAELANWIDAEEKRSSEEAEKNEVLRRHARSLDMAYAAAHFEPLTDEEITHPTSGEEYFKRFVRSGTEARNILLDRIQRVLAIINASA